MKSIKKFFQIMLMVVVLVAALPINAQAATYEVEAGDTVTVALPVTDSTGAKGTIEFSNPTMISSYTVSGSAGISGMFVFNSANNMFSWATVGVTTGQTVNVTLVISSSAKEGDSCTISVSGYQYSDSSFVMQNGSVASQTVVIKAAPTPTNTPTPTKAPTKAPTATPTKAPTKAPVATATPTPTKAPVATNTPVPTTAAPTEAPDVTVTVAPTETVEATPTPTIEVVPGEIDYTELEDQIVIAESLNESEYSAETWAVLADALEKGNALMGNANTQEEVDDAAEELKNAIAGLGKIDYSKLIAAIDSANSLIDSDELAGLWVDLAGSLADGEKALSSTSQAEVDAAAAEINALVEQIKALLSADTPVVKEEVEPSGKYCNIPMHKVWPILFFISLIGNIILLWFLFGKKKDKDNDNMPVVDYDIEEDD